MNQQNQRKIISSNTLNIRGQKPAECFLKTSNLIQKNGLLTFESKNIKNSNYENKENQVQEKITNKINLQESIQENIYARENHKQFKNIFEFPQVNKILKQNDYLLTSKNLNQQNFAEKKRLNQNFGLEKDLNLEIYKKCTLILTSPKNNLSNSPEKCNNSL